MIDNLDKVILRTLMDNARVSYADIAKNNRVSPATVHVRVEKMRKAGIIKGAKLKVDPRKLGFDVTCFIGIILKQAGDYPRALAKLEALSEVTEAFYTTGQYSIFIKVVVRNIDDLQRLLIERIQAIDEIQSTDTLISLQNPIMRDVGLDALGH
ncbi:transcriptional regulator AsnC [Aliidiomarina maris]|uniref:AsnC family transcriptional regulator n=1 Tax=Aliidiomarina maris TaxID=531312 RepID=A0A327X6S8_9GAMM|nr:transcriptional regulator AsnC [Aliidiomarina maris]MBA3989304.1 transcriptional regulator AsnC [Idiomarina sp.]MCL5050084.1 transcriptional regulator AsnC [Bacillota bacterium]RAK00823.1 AsnC family transcriptional regulator [Aliidiomarina maris]RUO27188.1 transcriptional regulator AsnC [Aliidiomarina maris]